MDADKSHKTPRQLASKEYKRTQEKFLQAINVYFQHDTLDAFSTEYKKLAKEYKKKTKKEKKKKKKEAQAAVGEINDKDDTLLSHKDDYLK